LTEKAAALYFPGRSAVGETLLGESNPIHIIGVVKDARYQSIRDVAPQTIYFDAFKPDGLDASNSWYLLVRTTASTASIASLIRSETKRSGRDVSIDSPMSFEQQAEINLVTDRLLAMLASGFAAVGCLLAAIGLYGVIAYSVARRTPEIGVRMALGAVRTDVVWTVFKEALALAVFGIVAGVALALAGGKLISSLLYQTQAADPFTLLATIAVLLCVVVTAGIVPAIRASRIDPMAALRWE
jgi:ABC-type antimicrobial peptide transport system permease subunit